MVRLRVQKSHWPGTLKRRLSWERGWAQRIGGESQGKSAKETTEEKGGGKQVRENRNARCCGVSGMRRKKRDHEKFFTNAKTISIKQKGTGDRKPIGAGKKKKKKGKRKGLEREKGKTRTGKGRKMERTKFG